MLTLKHLNEDTSWLISLNLQKASFNILVDPWFVVLFSTNTTLTDRHRLQGPQTDYWKVFSTQKHASPSCVDHVADLGVDIHAVVRSLLVYL